jgi:uncharacterized DUF497 family protein
MYKIEWDPAKDKANQKKHDISFEEAKSVFFDENALEFYDFYHSHEEERFLMLGLSYTLRILLICHCHKEDKEIIRIISARKATKSEQKEYIGG